MPQPIYAVFTGNTLKILPLTPYRGIIPEGTVINGFPDGIRGGLGVKLVKIEMGMFERVFFDLYGSKNTEYYPVKVTTADIGDGRPLIIREHLTNDEDCLWLNDLLDGPEKYLLGEFEKTRRNEPARFVFMRKFEYPDDMYEIHNPETKKCNVIDVSNGQLMFPDWCDTVEFRDGKWSGSNTPKLEGIDALAQAFVENVQTRFVSEDDLKKYASGEDIDKYASEVELKKLNEKAPEKKAGLVLVPADLVAIVARRMQAAAEYDGLNYVIDPEGLTLHLDNGYMTGTLSYDTYREALVSPTAGGTYPLDDNTDLDWITKKILDDMDPERFEEKIAGKYDEGRDLVATLASSLRSKAERMGRKFCFQEVGYKLSVENKETGDNYSSTVLEYDPEAKELKGKDGGSSFRLDDGTNIRKLASEIFDRTETMDL